MPNLRKYSRAFFKDKTASDAAQIPAGSATVNVYKQGATVSSGVTVTTNPAGTAVAVYHSGLFAVDDTAQVGVDDTKQMICVEVTSQTSIKLQSTIGQSIPLSAGERLVIYSDVPTLYSESTGASSTPNPAAANSRGLAEFYLPDPAFDIAVSGSGLTSTLYSNEQSGNTIGLVSTDRGDASVTLTNLADSEIQRFATTLTANRTVTLSTIDATPGAHFRIVRTGLGAFTLAIGSLVTVPPTTTAVVDVNYDGTAWRLAGYSQSRGVGGTEGQVSADRGDASVTIVHLVDDEIQRFATTLTANRTVTLSATNAVDGAHFRVVRTGLGAFTMDVGGLKTIASATAAFVDVNHDGTAWRLTGYGAL